MATLSTPSRTTSQISAKSLQRVVRSRALKQASRLDVDPQDVEDLAQDVILALLSNDAQILRRWKPSRHASFLKFVGVIAERQIVRGLRSRESRRAADIDWSYAVQSPQAGAISPEVEVASREVLDILRQRVGERVTQRGLRVFDALMVDQQSVESTSTETGISTGAIYVWRCRLRKLVRSLGRGLESDGAAKGRTTSSRRRLVDINRPSHSGKSITNCKAIELRNGDRLHGTRASSRTTASLPAALQI